MGSAINGNGPDQTQQRSHVADTLRNLQHVLAQCHDAVFITDRAGLFTRVNPAFERLTGYSSLEAVGRDLSLITQGGADSEAYREIWANIFRERAFSGTLQIQQKAGDISRLKVTITPVRDGRGRIVSLVGTGHQPELQSTAKAEEGEIDLWAGSEAAHDLNNALMVIGAHAELTRANLPADHSLQRNLQEIEPLRAEPLSWAAIFSKGSGEKRALTCQRPRSQLAKRFWPYPKPWARTCRPLAQILIAWFRLSIKNRRSPRQRFWLSMTKP